MRTPVVVRIAVLACLSLGSTQGVLSAALPTEGNRTLAGGNLLGVVVPVDVDTAPHPGFATSSASAGPGTVFTFFNEPITVLDGVRAEARSSSLPGNIGAYSQAGGGFTSSALTAASAIAIQTTYWRAVSSDPAVTHAAIDLTPIYDGALFVAELGSGAFANVNAVMRLKTTSFTSIVYSADATLLEAGLSTTGTAAWRASFVDKTAAPSTFGERYFEMAYAEFLANAFLVPVNETYAFESQLSTEARIPNSFEAWAIADFLRSGGFEMQTSTPGVTLLAVSAPIPWPAAVWLWLVGIACLVAKLRNRALNHS